MLFSAIALAQAGGTPPAPGFMDTLPMIAMIFFIFYFLIIRPQGKKIKKHNAFVTSMKRGDKVLTSGGIFGTIEGLSDAFVTLAIADDVSIRILKSQISSTVDNNEETKK